MPVTRLNHAVLYVRDAERAAAFYADALGFEVVTAMPGAVFLRAGGTENHHDLGLFSLGDGAPSPEPGRVGLYHLAWQVPTIEDLAATAEKLRSLGSLVGASDHGVSKSLYAKDPDGNEFEVMFEVPREAWTPELESGAPTGPLDLPAELERWGAHTAVDKAAVPYQQIAYEVADSIATITLNRPEKLNAFTVRMQQELGAAIDEVDADSSVRAVVLTGSGRAFCAGADLSPSQEDAGRREYEPDGRLRDEGGLLTLRFFACTKPMIGAINGPAVGIGATMTLPLDVRLASSASKIGFVFAKRGLVPEAASSYFLPRVVGISRAMEWCATGRIFGPDEAVAGGLVRSIHEPDDLLPAAYELAREIAENTSATSVTMTRAMLWHMLGASHPMEAHRVDSAITEWCFKSPDFREGAMSFLEKRAANYPNSVPADLPAEPIFPFWQDPPF